MVVSTLPRLGFALRQAPSSTPLTVCAASGVNGRIGRIGRIGNPATNPCDLHRALSSPGNLGNTGCTDGSVEGLTDVRRDTLAATKEGRRAISHERCFSLFGRVPPFSRRKPGLVSGGRPDVNETEAKRSPTPPGPPSQRAFGRRSRSWLVNTVSETRAVRQPRHATPARPIVRLPAPHGRHLYMHLPDRDQALGQGRWMMNGEQEIVQAT